MPTPRRETGWMTKADMCRVFDVAPQVFDRHMRPHIPPDCIRKAGRQLAFYARGAIDGYLEHHIRQADPTADDPLLAGAGSPALEKYREERAKLARLDRLEREGSLVSREAIHQGLTIIAARLRACGDLLEKRCGPEALQILDEALDDAKQIITTNPAIRTEAHMEGGAP